MQSNTCKLVGGGNDMSEALQAVERTCKYFDLGRRDALHIRLLAEETLGMVKSMIGECEADFWVEGDGTSFEIHLSARASADDDQKKALLSAATSGQNAAYKGFMGKVREIMEVAMYGDPGMPVDMPYSTYLCDPVYAGVHPADLYDGYDNMWVIAANRKKELPQEERDDLEKSIVANLADEVVVGVRAKRVEVVIKKKIA